MLDFESGEIGNISSTGAGARRASRSSLRAFAILSRSPVERILQMKLRPEVRQEVNELVVDYMRYHFQDSFPSRSDRVFAQLVTI